MKVIFIIIIMQGTVLCDIILLNFLKGAEQYKAKKFEEVKYLLFRLSQICEANFIKAALFIYFKLFRSSATS